jgi:hypothetical protein
MNLCLAGVRARLAATLSLTLALVAADLPAHGGPVATCTEAALVAQIAGGGIVTFGCDGDITLTGPILITNTVVLDGSGRDVRLVQTGNTRVFEVAANGSLTVTNLILTGGRSAVGGGAIFSRGYVLLVSCLLSNHVATGESGAIGRDSSDGGLNGGDGHNGGNGRRTAGGAVYNLGVFSAIESGFFNNRAAGGSGGAGGAGHGGEILGGDGGNGGSGGAALGGAVFNAGRVEFYSCGFDGNSVLGGDGAEGGELGEGNFPGVDGRGGKGAQAAGGALYCTNKSTALIVGCTFSLNLVTGGQSASGGTSHNSGRTGAAGSPVFGGGVANYGTAVFLNSTFFENEMQGGNGGDGDDADLRGGTGGAGGNAWGGNLFSGRASFLTNCTFYGGLARPGTNGVAGSGSSKGKNGDPGRTRGANLSNGKGKVILANSILANPPTSSSFLTNINVTWITNIIENVSTSKSNADEVVCTRVITSRVGGSVVRDTLTCLTNGITGSGIIASTTITSTTNTSRVTLTDNRANAYGPIKDGGYNLLSDLSIKFKRTSTSRGNIDPRLESLADNGGPTETMELLEDSAAIDAGSPDFILPTDQRGALRPSGYAGDIGAYEFEAILEGPPVITTQPIDNTVTTGSNATFLVVATGSPPLEYQWHRAPSTVLTGETAALLTVTNVDAGDVGDYFVVVSNDSGSVTSAVARLILNAAPVTVAEPADASVYVGENAAFSFQVSATPAPTFRWYFNGTNLLANATLSTLTLTNVQAAQAGTYRAIATNAFGSVTSRLATLTANLSPPVVVSEPADVAAFTGETVTFTYQTVGTPSPVYRWFFNSTNLIAGATNSSLILTNIQTTNVGTYHAIATNHSGSVTSRLASVTSVTNSAPFFSQQPPASTNVTAGATLVLTAVARGSRPMTFQWHFTDQGSLTTPIAGATNTTLTLPNYQAVNNGNYTLEAINAFGSEFSESTAVQLPGNAP